AYQYVSVPILPSGKPSNERKPWADRGPQNDTYVHRSASFQPCNGKQYMSFDIHPDWMSERMHNSKTEIKNFKTYWPWEHRNTRHLANRQKPKDQSYFLINPQWNSENVGRPVPPRKQYEKFQWPATTKDPDVSGVKFPSIIECNKPINYNITARAYKLGQVY
ncbi:unnamed protein product, partial [Owenia fusiformis]